MQRRSLVRSAGLAGVLAATAAPAFTQPRDQLRWRLATSFPKSVDTLHGNAEAFAKQVRYMTGGRFQISVHAGGELMPPFGVVDGVQNGTIEAAFTASYYFFGKDPTFALDTAIPFGLNSRQTTAWMLEGNGLKLMREFFAGYNIVSFPMGNTGAQMAGWYRKEIRSLADMKGLKMRIAGLAGVVLERLGVVPQNIPGGEVYQALEKGAIDATEFVGPHDDLKLGFNRVAPYYYYPGWWEGAAHVSLYVNARSWAALTPEYRAIVENAALHSHVLMQARYDGRNPGALKQLVASGTKLQRFPRDVLEQAFKVSQEVYAELSDRNPWWRRIYADYAAFRRDQHLWFRFAEGGFDDFMQRQKL